MAGLFILSLDTEIAWGTYGDAIARHAHAFDGYRPLLRRLLDMLDSYQIPATFAVVGHLFLAQDDPRAVSLRCPDHPDWYHAPDVIDAIRSTRTPHEIGTHTFTHIFTSEVTQDDWETELQMVAKLHEACGLTLRSIVYPRNQVAYTDRLTHYGIIAYRGMEGKWYRQPSGLRGRLLSYLDYLLTLPPVTYDPATPRDGDKLVNLPASQFLMSYDGLRGWIPTAARVRQAKLGIEQAVKRGHLYHLWFHPFNLGSSEKMFDALEQILRQVVRRRDAGELRVMTMQQVAEWILAGMPEIVPPLHPMERGSGGEV